MSEDERIAQIGGNAAPDVKHMLSDVVTIFQMRGPHLKAPLFGDSFISKLVVTDASIYPKSQAPLKKEGKVVCEITVDGDMINRTGNVDGGCLATLIDMCSTMSLMALGPSLEALMTVSQSLNIVYHSSARLGDRLRIVNTTITSGGRATSARTEIWNTTDHQLVASGSHIKMKPSTPKANL